MLTHWHAEDSPNLEFSKQAYDVWQEHVNWRTALAYDATRALIAALANKSPADRSSVQQALADDKFETRGATGRISFQDNGDREEQMVILTTVVESGGSYDFVPINKISRLECDRH